MDSYILHVAGPPGVGKTAFIEAVLPHFSWAPVVARGYEDEQVQGLEEVFPEDDPELERYRVAGASDTAVFRFRPGLDLHKTYCDTALLADPSHLVVVEGGCPFGAYDVGVFVTPVPPEGVTVPTTSADALYRGVEAADLVVVNVRDDTEWERAEAFCIEVESYREEVEAKRVEALRAGPEFAKYSDLPEFLWPRRFFEPDGPAVLTATVNLRDPEDPGIMELVEATLFGFTWWV